ncbi:glomulin-like [Acipenser ruthenus]|uniref:glomulin-like n=1 Tax=Acipenser ruthenus TaxID=7906 RepID=UPI002741BD54|nr:glomulin-like [Acipenser ruthenus]XP_058891030.1 glomulin-like [Acipenser ruthenus]XP_058891031.1 glomulin-like [Acipenser ruthenus]XP_058891032.1 glomulin-like [Acipenser ruthenus]
MALHQLHDVIRRCQAIPDDGFKAEDYDQFQMAGRSCLEEGKTAEVLDIVTDEKNKEIVKSMGWNLLGPLVKIVLKKEAESLQHCLTTLKHVLEVCSPKELLVGLLEQIEDADVDNIAETIILLLQPLQTALLKLGKKKASSLGMSLSTVLNQISQLPVPYTKEQEEEDVYGLCQCCAALIEFVKPFVDEVDRGRETKAIVAENEQRIELLKFCMKSLGNPVLQSQLDKIPDSAEDPPLRHFAAEILVILSCIGESFPALLLHHLVKKKAEPGFLEEDVKYPMESLACLSYLLFVQHIGIERFPTVFSPVFILQFNMQYIEVLLKRSEESMLSKGLELYEKSLQRTEDNSLPMQLLEVKCFLSVPQDLVTVMTLCPIQHLRTEALAVFQLYMDKFDTEGKHKLFGCLLKISQHAGVQGYIITNIKNQIDFSLKPGNSNVWFSGPQLLPLLHLVLSLPEGPETDLLQNFDRIMGSLNLLRYLLIRDKEWDNHTGIWTELYKIEENFLKLLHTGLKMSKAHYEAEIKKTKENNRKRGPKESKAVCTLTVGGEKLSNVTPEMHLQVLQSAMFTFDLIESVLARIEEIIEVKVKP